MIKILMWQQLSLTEQQTILKRPALKDDNELKATVANIINEVKEKQDQAIRHYTTTFDGVNLDTLELTAQAITAANQRVATTAAKAMQFAFKQIYQYHREQSQPNKKIKISTGVYSYSQTKPIEKIGLYIPGGVAPLPSTVLMLGVPSLIAGCKERIICTPPRADGTIDDNIIYAAKLCGIERIFTMGGAQAIAAMAYGTSSVPKVDKIYGPGNAWVTAAKMAVMTDPHGASCDLPAGPSELMIIADQFANPVFVAADLLSQAEHGCDAQVILITNSVTLAQSVRDNMISQLNLLQRRINIMKALKCSRIIVVDELNTAFDVSNRYAPEHLSVQINNPKRWIKYIQNAGAVFLGGWTSQTLGDYVIGTNHVLPTYGYSRVQSALGVKDFIKLINIQIVTRRGCKKIAPYAVKLAKLECLDAHANAVNIRLRMMK